MLPIEINERTKKKKKKEINDLKSEGTTTEREEYILKCSLRLEMTELNVWQMC
jgi:hypothetical protein